MILSPEQFLNELRTLLASDSYAATFQSMGAYRTALLRLIDASKKLEPEEKS